MIISNNMLAIQAMDITTHAWESLEVHKLVGIMTSTNFTGHEGNNVHTLDQMHAHRIETFLLFPFQIESHFQFYNHQFVKTVRY